MIIKFIISILIIIIILYFILNSKDYKNKSNNPDLLNNNSDNKIINDPPKGINYLEDIVYKVCIDKFSSKKWIQSCRDIPYLVNPYTKRRLEIDICCIEDKIAIELDGNQHFEYIESFDHNNEGISMLYKQIMRDCVKDRILKDNNWNFIRIKYTIQTKNNYEKTYNDIYEYLLKYIK